MLAQEENIAIMRVENGWLIRTNVGGMLGQETPLQVAETPGKLAQIVTDWAAGQAST